MPNATNLRLMAQWYRAFAERAENPVIWEARLITADDLDREADRVEVRTRPADLGQQGPDLADNATE